MRSPHPTKLTLVSITIASWPRNLLLSKGRLAKGKAGECREKGGAINLLTANEMLRRRRTGQKSKIHGFEAVHSLTQTKPLGVGEGEIAAEQAEIGFFFKKSHRTKQI